jgi:hypothetical protein
VFSADTLSGHGLLESGGEIMHNPDHSFQGTCSPYAGSRRNSGAVSAPTYLEFQTQLHLMSQGAAAAGSMRVSTAETEGRETAAVAHLASSAGPFGSFAAFPTADQAAGAFVADGMSPEVSAAFFGDTASAKQRDQQQHLLLLPVQQQQSTAVNEDELYLLPKHE